MKISTALTAAFAASSSAATCPVAIVDTLKTLVDTTNNLKVTVAALTATNIAANGGVCHYVFVYVLDEQTLTRDIGCRPRYHKLCYFASRFDCYNQRSF